MFATRREKTDDMRRERKRRSKKKVVSRINTEHDDEPGTPRTLPPSPSPTSSLRSDGDIRSPGQRKTPVPKAAAEAPIPDLITQTDRHGRATTPRSQKSIQKARKLHPSGPKPHLHIGKNGKLTEEDSTSNVDACAETFLDSIRVMCCCLANDDVASGKKVVTKRTQEEEVEDDGRPKLLPELHIDDHGKKCLVLDLDETLVHSSFRAVPNADFVIPVQVRIGFAQGHSDDCEPLLCLRRFFTQQIEDDVLFVYVMKRPGVDEFLVEMAKHYEVVIYTASLNKYADPLLDLLDPKQTIRSRLFRESCVYYEGNYVKDLSLLDRDLSQAIIVDNSPSSYMFHPENAIDCTSFIDDPNDRELDQIGAFLAGIKDVKDVRGVCQQWREWPNVNVEGQ